MIITCSHCGAQFNIKDEKIPDKGAQVRCLQCKSVFPVEKPSKGEQSPAGRGREDKNKKSEASGEDSGDVEIKREPEGGGNKGAPAWIVTFADLSTLMLTFFVLLLSFANMDIVKFRDMLGSVQEALGTGGQIIGDFPSPIVENISPDMPKPETYTEMKDSRNEYSSDDNLSARLMNQSMANEIDNTIGKIGDDRNISVKAGDDGVRVMVKGTYFFETGSASLKKSSFPFL